MRIQAIVFLACFCSAFAEKVRYGELIYLQLDGDTPTSRKIKMWPVDRPNDWTINLSVVSEIDTAGRDRKVRDVMIERRNEFINADDDKYTELKQNLWPMNRRACAKHGGWCIRCIESYCPSYYHSMDCSDDGFGSRCRAFTSMARPTYKCKSIPALMNPGCDLKGCVGNNRKTSVIRLYREPTCEISRVNFDMDLRLWEQQDSREQDHITNITFSGVGDDPIFRIQMRFSDCEPSVGCTVRLSSEALTGSGIYQPPDDGNWELVGDFYYKVIETVNNGQVARMNYSDAVNTCWDNGGDLPVLRGTPDSTPYVDGIQFYNYCKQRNYDCWLGLHLLKIPSRKLQDWLWRDYGDQIKYNNFRQQHLSMDDRLWATIVDLDNTETPDGLKIKSVSNDSLHAVVCQRKKNGTDRNVDDECPAEVKQLRLMVHIFSGRADYRRTKLCRQFMLTYLGKRLVRSFLQETDAFAERIDIQRYRTVSCTDFLLAGYTRARELSRIAPECTVTAIAQGKRQIDEAHEIQWTNGSSSFIDVFAATEESQGDRTIQ